MSLPRMVGERVNHFHLWWGRINHTYATVTGRRQENGVEMER